MAEKYQRYQINIPESVNPETGITTPARPVYYDVPISAQLDFLKDAYSQGFVPAPVQRYLVHLPDRPFPVPYDVPTSKVESFLNDVKAQKLSYELPPPPKGMRDRAWFDDMLESAAGRNIQRKLKFAGDVAGTIKEMVDSPNPLFDIFEKAQSALKNAASSVAEQAKTKIPEAVNDVKPVAIKGNTVAELAQGIKPEPSAAKLQTALVKKAEEVGQSMTDHANSLIAEFAQSGTNIDKGVQKLALDELLQQTNKPNPVTLPVSKVPEKVEPVYKSIIDGHKANPTLLSNIDKHFVRRIFDPNPDYIDNGDGSKSTHLMGAEIIDNGPNAGHWMVRPQIVRDGGKLVKLSPAEANDYAIRTGEFIDFGQDKEGALAFAENGYKKGTPLEETLQPKSGITRPQIPFDDIFQKAHVETAMQKGVQKLALDGLLQQTNKPVLTRPTPEPARRKFNPILDTLKELVTGHDLRVQQFNERKAALERDIKERRLHGTEYILSDGTIIDNEHLMKIYDMNDPAMFESMLKRMKPEDRQAVIERFSRSERAINIVEKLPAFLTMGKVVEGAGIGASLARKFPNASKRVIETATKSINTGATLASIGAVEGAAQDGVKGAVTGAAGGAAMGAALGAGEKVKGLDVAVFTTFNLAEGMTLPKAVGTAAAEVAMYQALGLNPAERIRQMKAKLNRFMAGTDVAIRPAPASEQGTGRTVWIGGKEYPTSELRTNPALRRQYMQENIDASFGGTRAPAEAPTSRTTPPARPADVSPAPAVTPSDTVQTQGRVTPVSPVTRPAPAPVATPDTPATRTVASFIQKTGATTKPDGTILLNEGKNEVQLTPRPDGSLNLDFIGTDKAHRGQGLAGKVLNSLIDEADKTGTVITLNALEVSGSRGKRLNPAQLKEFYASHGFVGSEGSDYMVYNPMGEVDLAKAVASAQKIVNDSPADAVEDRLDAALDSLNPRQQAIVRSRIQMPTPSPAVEDPEGAKQPVLDFDDLYDRAKGAIAADARLRNEPLETFVDSQWRFEEVPVESLRKANGSVWTDKFTHRGSMTKAPLIVGRNGIVLDGNNRLREAINRGDSTISIYRRIDSEKAQVAEAPAAPAPAAGGTESMAMANGKPFQSKLKVTIGGAPVKPVEPLSFSVESPISEDGEVDYDKLEALDKIAKSRDLGITRDREIHSVAVDNSGKVVGGAYTAYDGNNYTFDVVVDKSVEGNGVASKLLDYVAKIPYDILDQNPDATMIVDVVSPAMKHMLEKRGFKVTKQTGNERWEMTIPPSTPAPVEIPVTINPPTTTADDTAIIDTIKQRMADDPSFKPSRRWLRNEYGFGYKRANRIITQLEEQGVETNKGSQEGEASGKPIEAPTETSMVKVGGESFKREAPRQLAATPEDVLPELGRPAIMDLPYPIPEGWVDHMPNKKGYRLLTLPDGTEMVHRGSAMYFKKGEAPEELPATSPIIVGPTPVKDTPMLETANFKHPLLAEKETDIYSWTPGMVAAYNNFGFGTLDMAEMLLMRVEGKDKLTGVDREQALSELETYISENITLLESDIPFLADDVEAFSFEKENDYPFELAKEGEADANLTNDSMDMSDEDISRGKPVSLTHIVHAAEKAVRLAGGTGIVRVGKVKRGALGQYSPHTDIARIKQANNIPIATHELFHALLRAVYHKRAHEIPVLAKDPVISRELLKLGRALYGDSVPAGGYMNEGWAEFGRLLLTTDTVGEKAPALLKWFNGDFAKQNKKAYAQIVKTKKLVDQYRKQGAEKRGKLFMHTPSPVAEKILGNLDSMVSNFRKDWLTIADPLDKMVAEIHKINPDLPVNHNPAKMWEGLYLTHYGVVHSMVYDGMMDIGGKIVGPSLEEIAGMVKHDAEKFTLWLVHKHALEMHQNGIVSGISQKDAQYMADKLGSEKFELAAAKLRDWTLGLANYARGFGLLTDDAYLRMANKYKYYIPFFRINETSDITGHIERIFRKWGNMYNGARPSSFKTMKGSGKRIYNPWFSLMHSATSIVRASHDRAVMNSIFAVSHIEGMGKYIEKVPRDMVPSTLTLDHIKRQLTNAGVDLDGVDLEATITFFNPAYTPRGPDPIIPHMNKDGKLEWYRVAPDIYEMFMMNEVPKLNNPLMYMLLQLPNKLFKMGTVGANIDFAFGRNPSRDLPTFLMQSDTKYHPAVLLANWVQQLGKIMLTPNSKNEEYKYFKRIGGAMSQTLGLWTQHTKRTVNGLFRGRKVRNLMDPIDMFMDFIQIPESATRVTEMKLWAKEHGIDLQNPTLEDRINLALAAGRVTTNFKVHGKKARIANLALPFFNPNIQGPRQFARTFAKRGLRTMLRGLFIMTAFTAYLWNKNKDKKWFQDMDPQFRMRYWWIDGGDTLWKIPVPFEWGLMFKAIPEQLLNQWYKQDPDSMKEAAKYAADTLSPVGTPSNPNLPVLLKLALEQANNKIFFSDRPIVPKQEEDAFPQYQYGPYTTEVSKKLGKALDISPRRIDHVIQTVFGGVGSDIARLSGYSGKSGTEKELADYPILGAFVHRGGKANYPSVAMDTFYKDYEQVEKTKASRDKLGLVEPFEEKLWRMYVEDANKAMSYYWDTYSSIKSPVARKKIWDIMVDLATDVHNVKEGGNIKDAVLGRWGIEIKEPLIRKQMQNKMKSLNRDVNQFGPAQPLP